MTRLVIVKTLWFILLCFSLAHAQENQATPGAQSGPGYDYFIAHEVDSIRGYLNAVTMAHTDKILGFIREGKMDAAIFDVKYTLDRFANHPKGLQMAGIVAQLTKKPSLAIHYYERALKMYPQYAITYAQYGGYLVGNGQIDAGIERLKEAVEKDPKLAGAYALLAKAYAKNGKTELARDAADKARELGYKGETP